ncbi:tail fiber domain-containing protein [Ralstonia sp. Ralssp135]|uniref:tail fiber domain-containing protein n=1 Tax=Ralstonia sp. Ralssp135 TaxID=3243016 RepID=UPI0039B084B5
MSLWQWSTTPANNATAATAINWAEGQPPSTVNDSARQMMADVAAWYVSPEWLNYGQSPTYVSATQFTVTGNQTAIYSAGRRVRAFVTAGTIYGSVQTSAFTSVTTVTVTWDSGNLDSGLTEVDVGVLNPAFASFPALTNQAPGPLWTTANWRRTNKLSANNAIEFSGGTHNYGIGNSGGILYVFTAPDETTTSAATNVLQLDSSGNATFSGSITASSDERLKRKWKTVGKTFLERLSRVKSGTFERKKTKERQVGVGAQSFLDHLPELEAAISTDAKGYLSVAYGQAALVSCVELAKEVVRLRALVEGKK